MTILIAIFIVGVLLLSLNPAEAAGVPEHAAPPNVLGEWTGNWGAFDPTTFSGVADLTCQGLDCTVVQKNGIWRATFVGECRGPCQYTITMEGRQSGDVVLFKGTVDLGEKGGGIYDWVGRANDKEFVGFYTSARHVGVFQLSRWN